MKRTLLLAALMLGVSPPAYAQWAGDTVQLAYGYDLGSGTTIINGAGSPGNYVVPSSGTVFFTPFSLSSHQFSLFLQGSYSSFPFNGIILTDLSQDPQITGLTILSNTGSSNPGYWYSGNQIFVNFSGVATDGETVTFGLNFAEDAVPEPASWAMMIAGFGLVGASLRRLRYRLAFA